MDLNKECGTANLGGLIKVEYIPIEDIDYIPDFLGTNGSLTSPVVLNAGAVWYNASVIHNGFTYTENSAQGAQGESYTKKLAGFFPVDSPEIRKILKEMNRRFFVLKYTDSNGQEKLLGSKEYPYKFKSQLTTNKDLKQTQGHSLDFSSASPDMDVFIEI